MVTHHEEILVEPTARRGAQADLEHDRREIDSLDLRLIEILRDRRRISARIQQHRLNHGGERIAPGRERIVVERYRQALGPESVTLVEELLRLCRGPAAVTVADLDELSS